MTTVALDEDTFSETVQNNDMVLIDFWAEWCGPCRMFGPVYDKVSEDFPDVVFGKVDTEAQQGLGQAFNITSIPTLMAIREGVVLFSQPGALPEPELRKSGDRAQGDRHGPRSMPRSPRSPPPGGAAPEA